MNNKRIAMVFPYAPSYRDGIYCLLDERLNIDWFFANNCNPNLKLFDYSKLKRVNLSLQEKKIGPFSILKGCCSKTFKDYDVLIIPGVFRCLSDIKLMLGHKRGSRQKLFLWTHGWYGKESTFEKIIKKWCYRHLDGIFVYGNRAKELMIKEGFDGSRIFPIHNSLDYDKQKNIRTELKRSDIYFSHFGNDLPTILFIGRLTPVKRLNLIIEALSILKKREQRFNCVFVGDGSEKAGLESLVTNNKLNANVWFFGECFDELENARLIYNADLCVSPGNVGLTSIHSMMFGCPVISNDDFDHQMPEFEVIKPGITGDFFKGYDALSLADTIETWFKEHSFKREEVRTACYEVIDKEWNPHYQYNVFRQAIYNSAD